MQKYFFNSKTWQYLTLEELEYQARIDEIPFLINEFCREKEDNLKKDKK